MTDGAAITLPGTDEVLVEEQVGVSCPACGCPQTVSAVITVDGNFYNLPAESATIPPDGVETIPLSATIALAAGTHHFGAQVVETTQTASVNVNGPAVTVVDLGPTSSTPPPPSGPLPISGGGTGGSCGSATPSPTP